MELNVLLHEEVDSDAVIYGLNGTTLGSVKSTAKVIIMRSTSQQITSLTHGVRHMKVIITRSADHKSDLQCKTHEGHNYEVKKSTDHKSDSQCKAHEGHNYEVNKSTDHKSDSQCKTREGNNYEGNVQINRSEV